jgi:4-hydroxy-tetrahydrodipicolinate synthase
LTAAASAAGADAVLIVTPYYNRPNRAGLGAHFRAVAGATDRPVIIYNIPSRCVVNVDPDLLAELGGEIENVVAVKQANSDELQAIDGLDVLAGNDDVFLRCLELGGAGGILVASHLVGPQMRAVYEAARGGEIDRARALDEGLQAIYEVMGVTTNPIPVKTALGMLGVVDARMRLPMVAADAGQRDAIQAALERQGILAGSPS